MFSALPEDNVEYISFSKTALFIRNNVTEKVDIWENIHFSKVIDKVGRILTSLKFCFISFLAFLCKAVTSINFKEEGKLSDLIAPFMLVHKSSANYFINNSSRNIGFLQSFSFIQLKNFSFDFSNFLQIWIVWIEFWKFKLLYYIWKISFKVSSVSDSDVSVFSFPVRFIFNLDTDLLESKGFPKFLSVYNIFLIKIVVISSFF